MIHPKVQTIFLNQFKKGEITVFDDFAVKFNSFDKYKSSISSVLISLKFQPQVKIEA